MRIASVLTVCAVLTSTVIGAETARSKRRPEAKDQVGRPKSKEEVDPDEVTFTTLRPETATREPTARSNVHVGGSGKGFQKVRPGRSAARERHVRLRAGRSKANRRRRQLQRLGNEADGAKTVHELNRMNRIENEQVEAIQGPADAFEDGAIRIEPIYRVTKNKSILDAIVNVLKRIVDPPKSVGPLVGPFHFPGVGDKVYVRLLEPVQPDHLVVRLISHLPADEPGPSTLDENVVVTPSELIEHAEILPDHDSGSYAFDQRNDLRAIALDSSSSSSSNVAVHILKPNASDAKLDGRGKPWKTYKYKLHLKHPEKWNRPFVPFTKSEKNAPTRPATGSNRMNISFHESLYLPVNEPSRNHDLTPAVPVPRPPIDPADFHRSHHGPANVSAATESAVLYARFEPNLSTSHGSILPSYGQPRAADRPRYSIEFASKKMRYLNLDGSVVSGDDKSKSESGFRFDDRPCKPFRRMYMKESSTEESDRTKLRDRKDDDDESREADHSWKLAAREPSSKESTPDSKKCCWQQSKGKDEEVVATGSEGQNDSDSRRPKTAS